MKQMIIAAEGMAIIVSIVLLYGNHYETRQKDDKRKAFALIVVVNLIAMICDMLSWMMDGIVACSTWNYYLTGASMYLSFAIGGCFTYYLYMYVSERRNISFTLFKILIIYSVAATAIIGMLCGMGLIFTIEAGVYVQGPLYNFYLVLNLASLVFGLGVIISSARHLGRHDTVAFLSYIILPLICIGINAVNEDFSMVYPAITISLLVLYVMLQAESQDILIRSEMIRSHQAMHDDMTGVLNRRAFVERISKFVAEEGNVGVIFCDINGLKYTNDNFGHEAGDELIIAFTTMLQSGFRKDEIYRISGDEFVILLPDISETLMLERAEMIKVSENRFGVQTASIGCTYGSKSEVGELIKSAEWVMYEDKLAFYETYPKFKR